MTDGNTMLTWTLGATTGLVAGALPSGHGRRRPVGAGRPGPEGGPGPTHALDRATDDVR